MKKVYLKVVIQLTEEEMTTIKNQMLEDGYSDISDVAVADYISHETDYTFMLNGNKLNTNIEGVD